MQISPSANTEPSVELHWSTRIDKSSTNQWNSLPNRINAKLLQFNNTTSLSKRGKSPRQHLPQWKPYSITEIYFRYRKCQEEETLRRWLPSHSETPPRKRRVPETTRSSNCKCGSAVHGWAIGDSINGWENIVEAGGPDNQMSAKHDSGNLFFRCRFCKKSEMALKHQLSLTWHTKNIQVRILNKYIILEQRTRKQGVTVWERETAIVLDFLELRCIPKSNHH